MDPLAGFFWGRSRSCSGVEGALRLEVSEAQAQAASALAAQSNCCPGTDYCKGACLQSKCDHDCAVCVLVDRVQDQLPALDSENTRRLYGRVFAEAFHTLAAVRVSMSVSSLDASLPSQVEPGPRRMSLWPGPPLFKPELPVDST